MMGTSLRPVVMLLTCAVVFGCPTLADGQEPRTASDFGTMGLAKVLCSAVFVSGRDLDEALLNSATFASTADRALLRVRKPGSSKADIRLDRKNGLVQVTLHGFTGRAKYIGDQGCVILPPGFDDVFFKPVQVTSSLPDTRMQPWPMGDVLPDTPLPAGLDEAKIEEAVDAAFADESLTAAFVAVYKGRIIGERYGQGANKDTQLESWSMGKSLTATLIGVLSQQGHLRLDDPAPVELWRHDPEDPRSQIKISDLMRMSSGLRFTHASQPAYEWGRALADHLYIYAGVPQDAYSMAGNRGQYAIVIPSYDLVIVRRGLDWLPGQHRFPRWDLVREIVKAFPDRPSDGKPVVDDISGVRRR